MRFIYRNPERSGILSFSVGYRVKKMACRILKQIKHQLKALRSFIIRIRHISGFGIRQCEIGHAYYFILILDGGSQPAEVVIILAIHADQQIKPVEISLANAARPMIEPIAAT